MKIAQLSYQQASAYQVISWYCSGSPSLIGFPSIKAVTFAKILGRGPYIPFTVTIPVVPAIDDTTVVPEQTAVETILNLSPKNKEHYQSEKVAIHLLLTGIRDEICSTVDACKTAYDMWIAIERLQHVTFARTRETVGSQVVQQTGIQCFNYKEFGHFAKEYRKPKRVKDYTYHKKKILICKQAEKGVPLLAKQADWLADTNEEIDKKELEAYYSFMAEIQEVLPLESNSNVEPLKRVQKDVEYNVFANSDQNAEECDDECVTLANLVANLKLDVDENKKIQKQLKKANTSLAHELKECKSILAETSRTLGESNSTRDSCLISLQNKHTELETYKTLNDRTVDYDKLEHSSNHSYVSPQVSNYNGRSTIANHLYLKKAQSKMLCSYEISYDTSDPANRFTPDREETLTLEKESISKLNKDIVKPYDYSKLNSLYEIFKPTPQVSHEQLAYANEVRKKIELVDQAWEKHSHDHFRAPAAHDIDILIKTCLMPLALKTQNDSFQFIHELKQEMHDDKVR
nr:hypothetical protein [Tanacetum cinerariifolium]